MAKPVDNVILVTIDSCRADHINLYGYEKRRTSPNIDQLGKEGAVFTEAVSNAPYTSPSFFSMFTSSYPTGNPYSNTFCRIPSSKQSLLQILKMEGYKTVAFQDSNPFLSSKVMSKSFDQFQDYIFEPFGRTPAIIEKMMDCLPMKREITNFLKHYLLGIFSSIVGAERITNEAIYYISENRTGVFLWLHYMDVHGPHIASQRKLKRIMWALKRLAYWYKQLLETPKEIVDGLMELYDEEIKFVDYNVGKLVQALKKDRLLDNTTIILTSDHGEEFGEHGGYGHTAKLYEELIKVPLIIMGPHVRKTKKDKVVSHLDLAPTILDLLSVRSPPNFEGRMLLRKRDSYQEEGNEGVICNCFNRSEDILAYRTKEWKFIVHFDNLMSNIRSFEAYNLDKDPYEQNNLIETIDSSFKKKYTEILIAHKEIRKKRVAKTNALKCKRFKVFQGMDKITIEQQLRQRLRKLGYVCDE